ncbi:hypothetical protein [Myxacorys almedinensis]|uniref:Uncharacterized protein n=1 Tax=Myxacorys almedinensis A TaxID=2690445 RepID=A0A8J7YXX9_9CYAN|nr:hypothetical protein [Myxacorys almedinensis]NDJ16657.1 hypothetical protein [Myxacorys almedinensis A]
MRQLSGVLPASPQSAPSILSPLLRLSVEIESGKSSALLLLHLFSQKLNDGTNYLQRSHICLATAITSPSKRSRIVLGVRSLSSLYFERRSAETGLGDADTISADCL